jgi:hypothetical protein
MRPLVRRGLLRHELAQVEGTEAMADTEWWDAEIGDDMPITRELRHLFEGFTDNQRIRLLADSIYRLERRVAALERGPS